MANTEVTLVRDYAKFEETGLVVAAGAGEQTANTATFGVDVSNSKFLVEVEVTETSAANGGLDIRLQGSMDNTTFLNVGAVGSLALNTMGTNKASAWMDATSGYAPYWRIQVFTDGTNMLDSASVSVRVVAVDSRARIG